MLYAGMQGACLYGLISKYFNGRPIKYANVVTMHISQDALVEGSL